MQGCVAKYKAMAEAAQSELSPRTIAQDDLQKIHVHEALVAAHGISGLTLSVYVFMAKVFVVGHVDTHEQIESVLKTARQVAGVRSADGYLPLKDGQASDATVGGLTSDATMKAHIISALAVTPGVVNSRIHVEVLDGHVVLLGVVSGQEEQFKAGRAAVVEGVKDVTNWLLLPESRYMSIRRKVL
ncbi:transporter [Nitrospira sp. KM1]|nr:transporter [Nitrospira sp. KM1]